MAASLEPMSNADRFLLLSMALAALTVSVIGILSISKSDCDKLIPGGYAAYLILQGQLMFGQKLHAFIYKVPMEPSKQVRVILSPPNSKFTTSHSHIIFSLNAEQGRRQVQRELPSWYCQLFLCMLGPWHHPLGAGPARHP